MKASHVPQLRVTAHHLGTNKLDTPEAVVRSMLAMQSQDYNGGLWSIGARMKHPSKKAVEQAIIDRRIVRTWPMRGTLHFVHADDVHWLLDLLAVRATAAAKSRRINTLGLHDEAVAETEQIVRKHLSGGKILKRSEIKQIMLDEVKSIALTSQHTEHLLRNFGERGVICFGPYEGKQPTIVLLDEWIPKPAEKPRDEALKELATRYFTSHGPATLKDFSGWGMMTMKDARQGLEAAEDSLESAIIDGTTYYFAPHLVASTNTYPLLLSGFDEYLLGYKDRSAVLDLEHTNKIVPGNNGMFLATVVNSGKVIGLWKKKLTKNDIIHDYISFSDDIIAAEKSEAAYQTFLES